jgi:hypothetical protein
MNDRRERRGLTVMRKQFVALTLIGLAIATTASGASSASRDESSVAAAPTVAVHRVGLALPAMRDEAAMVLVGTLLIGLGAAVRRVA